MELTDGGFRVVSAVKFNHTRSTRTAIWFVLDLRTLDFANGGKELDEVFIGSGPW